MRADWRTVQKSRELWASAFASASRGSGARSTSASLPSTHCAAPAPAPAPGAPVGGAGVGGRGSGAIRTNWRYELTTCARSDCTTRTLDVHVVHCSRSAGDRDEEGTRLGTQSSEGVSSEPVVLESELVHSIAHAGVPKPEQAELGEQADEAEATRPADEELYFDSIRT